MKVNTLVVQQTFSRLQFDRYSPHFIEMREKELRMALIDQLEDNADSLIEIVKTVKNDNVTLTAQLRVVNEKS